MSDNYWGRYGEHALWPGILAELQEVCATATPPARPVQDTVTTVSDVLSVRFLPCAGLPVTAKGTAPAGVATCVVYSNSDSVTPANLIRATYRSFNPVWIISNVRSHRSMDGLDKCLSKVVRQPSQS